MSWGNEGVSLMWTYSIAPLLRSLLTLVLEARLTSLLAWWALERRKRPIFLCLCVFEVVEYTKVGNRRNNEGGDGGLRRTSRRLLNHNSFLRSWSIHADTSPFPKSCQPGFPLPACPDGPAKTDTDTNQHPRLERKWWMQKYWHWTISSYVYY